MSFDPAKPSLISTLVRHYDDLVDHVRRRFGDRGFAREVVHDVCVQLLEKREREDVRTPLALLRKISHDQAISRYRSERRRQALVVALPDLSEPVCEAPCHRVNMRPPGNSSAWPRPSHNCRRAVRWSSSCTRFMNCRRPKWRRRWASP